MFVFVLCNIFCLCNLVRRCLVDGLFAGQFAMLKLALPKMASSFTLFVELNRPHNGKYHMEKSFQLNPGMSMIVSECVLWEINES